MRPNFTRALLLAGAVFASATISPAFAQDSEIVVTPGGGVYEIQRERGRTNSPTSDYSLSQVVTTKGLDLRDDRDVAELERRIDYTAREVCDVLGEVVEDTTTSDARCYRRAVESAAPQARDAVARARG